MPGRARLARLAVRDFRNLAHVELEPPADGLVVVGENGQGKTNLLESIYYLQILRSARGARDQDLVRFGAEAFHIGARVETDGCHEVGVGFERATRRKRVRIDGEVPDRLSDALGALPSVFFSPSDVELVAGAPAARRRYLDIMLALTTPGYLRALQGYRAALARRNAALREHARSGRRSAAAVSVWEPALAAQGAVLIDERRTWVAAVRSRFEQLCHDIGEAASVRVRYAGSIEPGLRAGGAPEAGAPEEPRQEAAAQRAPGDGETEEPSEPEATARAAPGRAGRLRGLADRLAAALEEKRGVDLRRGLTHVGPHRDDLVITIAGDDGTPRELRTFGSAGQQRSAAIALRMLEASTFTERTGRSPVFLLDDPFAELDARRSARVLSLLSGSGLGQTLLAVPRPSDVPPEFTGLDRVRIAAGEIVPFTH